MSDEKQKIIKSGGTYFLCLWLFAIALNSCSISSELQKQGKSLEIIAEKIKETR